jgi:hypothetical protein
MERREYSYGRWLGLKALSLPLWGFKGSGIEEPSSTREAGGTHCDSACKGTTAVTKL